MGSLTVDYKGDTIHSASSTGSATLKTSGKYMEDDVELTYSFDAATGVASSNIGEAIIGTSKIYGEVEEGVEFIDYDGTVVEAWGRGDVASKTELPANPAHGGLTAQGWNWTLNEIKTYAASYPNALITVGQMYTPTSGATEIDIVLDNENYLSPYLNLNGPTGTTIEVDWGDGSSKDTISGNNAGSAKYTQHTYATTGSYTIKIEVTSSSGYCYSYKNGSSSMSFLNISNTNTSYNQSNRIYANTIKAIRLHNSFRVRNYTFSYLTNLEYITFPNNLHTNTSSVFNYCFSLKCLIFPASLLAETSDTTNTVLPSVSYCYSVEKISCSNSITSFSTGFQSLYILKNFTIGSQITSLPQSMFSSCYSLRKIIVPSGVTTINTSLCSSCYNIEYVELPSTVNTISLASLFYMCYNLKKAVFKNNNPTTVNSGITAINGSTQFCYNCQCLEEITMPKKLAIIGNNYFYSCCLLKSVEIPSDVTDIGNSSFSSCTALETITIPSKVATIGTQCFSTCYSLQEIHFEPTTPPTVANSNAWSSLPNTCTIYVPTGHLSDYTSANNYPSSITYTYVEE